MLASGIAIAAANPFSKETIALNQQWGETVFATQNAAPKADQLILLHEDHPGNTKVNCAAVGSPLRLGSKTYARGIGSNSRCEMRVRLSHPAERFMADIGLDRNVYGTPGSVQFQVLANGTEVFCSDVIRPNSEALSIDVPLNRATEFDLILNDGGDGRDYDQGDWCDARVVLKDGSTVWLDALKVFKTHAPHAAVVILTMFDDQEKIFQSVSAGASGYLLKTATPDSILGSIRDVHAGGAPMNPKVARAVMDMFAKMAGPRLDNNLIDRERDVLKLMTEGLATKQIADRLELSYHTIDTHLRHIYAKLHVHNRSEAVARALRERMF